MLHTHSMLNEIIIKIQCKKYRLKLTKTLAGWKKVTIYHQIICQIFCQQNSSKFLFVKFVWLIILFYLVLRWNLVCDERECHLCWLVILKSSSTSTMDLTSKEERSQCHTLNHCWVVHIIMKKADPHMYIYILPHIESFLAAFNFISSIQKKWK